MSTHYQRRQDLAMDDAHARFAARDPAQWLAGLGWQLMEFTWDWPVILAWNVGLAGLMAAGGQR